MLDNATAANRSPFSCEPKLLGAGLEKARALLNLKKRSFCFCLSAFKRIRLSAFDYCFTFCLSFSHSFLFL